MELILSLGSNLGNRLAYLETACRELTHLPASRIVARAPIYLTEPVEVADQYRSCYYYNTITILETTLTPEECSAAVHAIEERMGRQRDGARNTPRQIDIDLIACGSEVRSTPQLTLPHPTATRRRFVLQPLADLRPALQLPGTNASVSHLLAQLPPLPAVTLAPETWSSVL